MPKTFLLIAAAWFAACLPAAAQTPTQEYLVGATLYTQSAAEYRALCYQAYNLAELRLLEALRRNPARPAVILDLDETVLDNSAYTGWQIATDQPYSPDTWARWTELAAAPLVPGAARFLHLADSLGVTLLYVSNRLENERDATQRNMQAHGLPQVQPDHFFLKSSSSDKTERRAAIIAQGYDILLLIGDNLGDFDGQWEKLPNPIRNERADAVRDQFGSRYIVLPNAIYGTWEGALYQFNWSASPGERDSMRRAGLRAVELE
ncbi:MAG: 5'-nucleotidase, lipoprotein e(P4) family [Bacteroidetes bacterium]|nr:5'-nucleotidase, lipoprotein e(P4) family [Bacteroidota bacterium]